MDTAKTYYCQNCGAVMEFDAASQNLKCPSCGNKIEIENDESKVVEHKLTRHALNSIKPEQKTSTSMECEGCGALVEVDSTSTATTCPYCGSNYVLAKKQMDALIPDGVVPFRIDKVQTGEIYHKWIKGRWLAPNTLKTLYQTDKIQGIYIPYWTFDADIDARYRAMGGEDYEVSYKDDEGEIQTEIRTRWYPTSGHVHNFFDDVLIRASNKLKPNLLNSLVYNTQNISSYSPDYMSGYCADGKEYHVLINGQSGVISGEYPKSVFKIAMIIIVIIIIIALAFYYVNS